MKYRDMADLLNNNGINIIRLTIAHEVDSQLEMDIKDEEFEDICKSVYRKYKYYLGSYRQPSIWELVCDEIRKREWKFYI